MTGDDCDLDRAYEIDGPEEARRLYGCRAETHDDSFGDGWGYSELRSS